MGRPDSFFAFWGKAGSILNDNSEDYHLLPYHCLDVAAVGSALLDRHPALQHTLIRMLGAETETVKSWITFFLAVHDLGKFAETFQNLRRDLFERLLERKTTRPYSERHDRLGFVLWKERIWPRARDEDWFCIGARTDEYCQEVFTLLAGAVTGHHGQPSSSMGRNTSTIRLRSHFLTEDLDAAVAFACNLRSWMLPQTPLPIPNPGSLFQAMTRCSWLIAGIAVLSDWIGSSSRWFPFVKQRMTLSEYWTIAQKRAARAIEEAGILPSRASPATGIARLFPKILQPSPLQDYVSQCKLSEKPQLWIVEDVTGSGKTEAALTLAHRMIVNGLGDGVFVALPTMATANAMYDRVASAYRRLFSEECVPSLVLAHSARRLSTGFRQSIIRDTKDNEPSHPASEDDAGPVCAAWLADNRKKALLADVGVGTLDQALLAVLRSNHQSLRLLGLCRKILIVDEVHSYDPYMNQLLRSLLRFQAALGGSAVLLSATVPESIRRDMIAAFSDGLDGEAPLPTAVTFPLATCVCKDNLVEVGTGHRPDLRRTVRVELIHDLEAVASHIVQAARNGAAVCWVRNTVADAREAFDLVRGRLETPERVRLFHARFAMGDRLAIEGQVIWTFGKNSGPLERDGQVLIATQVVEQSLDLDFDVMITDLAPIDLLIQRAGRLRRHPRDYAGNLLKPPGSHDERGEPCLMIFSPLPIDNPPENWFSSLFPGASLVYPHHASLWLTARMLAQRGCWTMPDDARDLIEGVFGESAQAEIPSGLVAATLRSEGASLAEMSLAGLNTLTLECGYSDTGGPWQEDEVTPTRLGEPTITVRLARWDGENLQPWSDNPIHPWEMSDVSVRRSVLNAEAQPQDQRLSRAIALAKEHMPDKGKWRIVIPLGQAEHGLWQGRALHESGQTVDVVYSPVTGFHAEREGKKK